MHRALAGLVLLCLGGCCGDMARRDDALRRRRYELEQREARLRAAERRFEQCMATKYPGQDSGLRPAPAPADATDAPGEEAAAGAAMLTPEQLEEIRRVERIGQASLVACYEEELERRKTKDLVGKVVVKILIGTNGVAQQVSIVQSSLAAPTAHGCMIKAVKTWEFPELSAPAWYSTTFSFSPAY